MATHTPHPPWQYLRHASQTSLQSFELSRLNHAANLRKEIVTLVDQWVEENASALLARWLLEHWAQLRRTADSLEKPLHLDGDPFGEVTPAFAARGRIVAQMPPTSVRSRTSAKLCPSRKRLEPL